ncbi:hypothetical protein Tco_0580387 [Tanacetum coccineum]
MSFANAEFTSSRPHENFHTILESLPTSTTLVEDSDSNREEIDIFSRPDDSIPPGIESDFDSEEDIIDNLLNDDPISPKMKQFIATTCEPMWPMINNVDELNKMKVIDPMGKVRFRIDPKFSEDSRVQCFVPVHSSFLAFACH